MEKRLERLLDIYDQQVAEQRASSEGMEGMCQGVVGLAQSFGPCR